MKLVKATEQDFQRITQFYRDVIAHTEHMDIYARWIYGQHPTDDMIQSRCCEVCLEMWFVVETSRQKILGIIKIKEISLDSPL